MVVIISVFIYTIQHIKNYIINFFSVVKWRKNTRLVAQINIYVLTFQLIISQSYVFFVLLSVYGECPIVHPQSLEPVIFTDIYINNTGW